MACSSGDGGSGSSGDTVLEERYMEAIKDAMITDEDELYDGLIDIVETNRYLQWSEIDGETRVLVVTWTRYPDSYPVGETIRTWWGDTWVTMVPEITDWFSENDLGYTEIICGQSSCWGCRTTRGTHTLSNSGFDRETFSDRRRQRDYGPDGPARITRIRGGVVYRMVSYYHCRFVFSHAVPLDEIGLHLRLGSSGYGHRAVRVRYRQDSEVVVESNTPTEVYLQNDGS